MSCEVADHPSPILSIVIVNSNGTDDTLRCLESIYSNAPAVNFEVVLVDNCSELPCFPLVEKKFPEVQTYQAPEVQGFAKNYNLGMSQARGEFILILNNDTLVHPGAIDKLLKGLREQSDYGMVGPKLLAANGKIQTPCARPLITPLRYILIQLLLDPGLPVGKLWERIEQRNITRRSSGQVPCISGACMLLPKRIVEQVGFLDEGYDFYYEDVEWCRRIQEAGYQVAYIAEAEVTHLGDQSLSRVKEWAKQSEYRSILRYFRQYHHLSGWQFWVLWLVTMTGYWVRAMAFLLLETITRRRRHARAYLNLSRWIVQMSPARANL